MTAIDLGPRYKYVRDLGEGGVGRVVLVRDAELGREVALKVLHAAPAGAAELEEFQREFSLLAKVEHPSIAKAYDFGYLGGVPYFTSEFIPGEPLDAGVRSGDLAGLVSHARSIAAALALLHGAGILHLDVKPRNVILSSLPGRSGPVLIDFGLFRSGFPRPAGARIKGSLPFMAPEYFRRGILGPWTDVYALGVTLYRLATGRFPRAGRDRGADGSWDPVPTPPASLATWVSGDLERVILKCLALDPALRFAGGKELAEALACIEGGLAVAPHREQRVLETVGRESELSAVEGFLGGVLDRVKAPDGAAGGVPFLLVSGPGGMGQSRLFGEIKVRAQTRGLHCHVETGYPGRAVAPGSVFHALGAHAAPKARARWGAFLARLAKPRKPLRDAPREEERRLRWVGELRLAVESLREPVLLAVDGLQYFDEVSILLLLDLLRLDGDRRARQLLGVIAGYREEGPSARWLADLTRHVLERSPESVIALGSLGPVESADLFRRAGGRLDGQSGLGLKVFQDTGGSPRKILDLALHGAGGSGAEPAKAGGSGRIRQPLRPEERGAVLVLGLLERPASEREVSLHSGIDRRRLRKVLESLEARGLVSAERSPRGVAWIAGGLARSSAASAGAAERRRMHLRIARGLLGSASSHGDSMLLEAVSHIRKAGSTALLVRHGLTAARYLKSTFQCRAALEAFRSVLEALPPKAGPRRLEVTLELADLLSWVGHVDEGIRLLGDAVADSRRLSSLWHARVLLRLAALHSRRGDFRRADALFREGLSAARSLPRAERLFFLNEHAALKAFTGDHAGALALAGEGLRIAGTSPSGRGAEIVLNLHATRGNVALRRFEFEEAASHFETALEIAEAAGSTANQAVILNNLGIVYSQSDRFLEAIRTFEDARKACLKIDEGPSLTFIHGNLAVLHAKTGDFAAASRALRAAEEMCGSPGEAEGMERSAWSGVGRRQQLFLEHHRGLASLYEGRYADARRRFEAALRAGAGMGDSLVTAFDEVYRAEALIFLGAYSEAGRELTRLAGEGYPPRVRRMALARLAFLRALGGEAKESAAALSMRREIDPGRTVPFLDAWDDVFGGWALSLTGDAPRAEAAVGAAESYFRRHGLEPGAALARWIAAEARLLEGQADKAHSILESAGPPRSALLEALVPLLRARLSIEDPEGAPLERCGDLLTETGAAFVGNPLPEWEMRLLALRGVIGALSGGGSRQPLRGAEDARRTLARDLPEPARRAYIHSRHWRRWSRGLLRAVRRDGSGVMGARGSPGADSTRTSTVTLRGGGDARAGLVARSVGMRRLTAALDRLRDSELPVVIEGETGTGKELVARVIHAESRRFAGPFVVIDLATIPAPLVDVELFGARAGAFTDLPGDRAGIMEQARGGTVLVDEVAGAPPEIQAKLLRVLSERSARPVGSELDRAVDVRFLFATARDVDAEARAGRLREDLLHRIRVVSVRVPPLRERLEDLPALIEVILREGTGPVPRLEEGVIERLGARPWPGNVRELRNMMARLRLEHPAVIPAAAASAGAGGAVPAVGPFPESLLAGGSLEELARLLEREFLRHHLRRTGGDALAVSRLLGVSRKHLYRRLKQLGIRLRSSGDRGGE